MRQPEVLIMTIAQAKEKAMKGAQKIMDQIPKAVEKSPFLQNTLTMIAEMQHQAQSIKKDAGEEVHKILEVLHHSYSDVESKARKASDSAKKQAKSGLSQLIAKWEEKKDHLPKNFVGQMDNLLKQVGLTHKATSAKKPATKKAAAAKKTPVAKKETAAKKTTSIKKPIRKIKPA
jgi:hypothetical protein